MIWFPYPQELRSKNGNGCGPISNLIVLNFGDVHQHLGRRVVHTNGPQDSCSIVRDLGIGVSREKNLPINHEYKTRANNQYP